MWTLVIFVHFFAWRFFILATVNDRRALWTSDSIYIMLAGVQVNEAWHMAKRSCDNVTYRDTRGQSLALGFLAGASLFFWQVVPCFILLYFLWYDTCYYVLAKPFSYLHWLNWAGCAKKKKHSWRFMYTRYLLFLSVITSWQWSTPTRGRWDRFQSSRLLKKRFWGV